MRIFLTHAIFLVFMYIGWIRAMPKKTYPVILPDESWPDAPGLDTEAGRKWEKEQNRKEGIRYAGHSGKKTQGRGKRNRKGPADKADGKDPEVV